MRQLSAKRVNASSGGLHPIECFVINDNSTANFPLSASSGTSETKYGVTMDLDGDQQNDNGNKNSFGHSAAVVAHYVPACHGMEVLSCRREGDDDMTSPTPFMVTRSFSLALSAVDWREIWKYGFRGLRYTYLVRFLCHASVILV